MVNEAAISERAQILLKILVERYIREGQPVGSSTLVRESGLGVSSATVRNIMSDLEELGFVKSPHTSAGRVPTVQGYRLFVDSLIKVEPLHSSQVRRIQASIDPDSSVPDLLHSTTSLLSGVTRMAGVVMLPHRSQPAFRHIEFLPLSDNRVLVIWVVNEHEVQNRVISLDRPYRASELQEAANYLNHEFSGKSLRQIRETLLLEMREAREQANRLMMTAVAMAEKAFAEPEAPAPDLVMEGQSNLLAYDEMADMEKLRELFEAFNQKRGLLELLDQAAQAQGVQIFIGEESGYHPLDDCSVVTSPYSVDGQVIGVLGVIGPTRMAYNRVIPIVDVTAKLLGAALNRGR